MDPIHMFQALDVDMLSKPEHISHDLNRIMLVRNRFGLFGVEIIG